jgi:hypothetical protein
VAIGAGGPGRDNSKPGTSGAFFSGQTATILANRAHDVAEARSMTGLINDRSATPLQDGARVLQPFDQALLIVFDSVNSPLGIAFWRKHPSQLRFG